MMGLKILLKALNPNEFFFRGEQQNKNKTDVMEISGNNLWRVFIPWVEMGLKLL